MLDNCVCFLSPADFLSKLTFQKNLLVTLSEYRSGYPDKNHKATKPAFNVGPSLARQLNAI